MLQRCANQNQQSPAACRALRCPGWSCFTASVTSALEIRCLAEQTPMLPCSHPPPMAFGCNWRSAAIKVWCGRFICHAFQQTLATHLGVNSLRDIPLSRHLIQLTTSWWSVDTSAPLVTHVASAYGPNRVDHQPPALAVLLPRAPVENRWPGRGVSYGQTAACTEVNLQHLLLNENAGLPSDCAVEPYFLNYARLCSIITKHWTA